MSTPTPILLVVRSLDLGGSERQLAEVARTLDKSRFEVHVGCFHSDGVRAAELKAAGIPIVTFPVKSFRSLSVLAAARQLARYVQQHKIDLVHAFDVPATIFSTLAVRLYAADTVVMSSQRAHRELVSRPLRSLLRLTDRVVDGVVVNCRAVERHLIQDEQVPSRLIHICRNGVDVQKFFPAEVARPAALDGALVIGVVTALRPEKNLYTLTKAFAMLPLENRRLKLAIVGSGSELAGLRAQAESLGISERCVFEPATGHVADWLRAIDIFVLPSRSEALSNSLMEAMACGCAVVASRVGGNGELVEHGRTGLLFESGDAAGLSAAIQALIVDRTLRESLGGAAARLMREQFSMSGSARRMGDIYSTMLNGPGLMVKARAESVAPVAASRMP